MGTGKGMVLGQGGFKERTGVKCCEHGLAPRKGLINILSLASEVARP